MTFYDFKAKNQDGTERSLSECNGKVVLIVNTATGCGFTPQYKELQEYYDKYRSRGLEILDFPCNQFGEQAPGSDEEIHAFCTGRFGITFPQFAKIDVNGEYSHPLYRWLRKETKFGGFGKGLKAFTMSLKLKLRDWDFKNNSDIKWNFTKFLLDRNGKIIGRFEPTQMNELRIAIEKEMAC